MNGTDMIKNGREEGKDRQRERERERERAVASWYSLERGCV